jgi:N-acetylglutamate synthase
VSSTLSPEYLEDVAYDLWCATEVEELDGWRLRFAHSVSGRANSVWPNRDGSLALPEKLERVEAWYAARRVPARFQLTEAARPRELTEALLARGYEWRGAPVSVEVAKVDDVVALSWGDASVSDEVDDAWVELWTGTRGFDRVDIARAILSASPGPTVFARVDDLAVGRGVVLGEWLGITSMATVPEARGRGHGRAIVHALARWGERLGATRALLQVEETNVPARALYSGVGFAANHAYRYCVQR